jgi:hypothetical protein
MDQSTTNRRMADWGAWMKEMDGAKQIGLPSCKLLVFYVGNILDDKNTLCNGCILNRLIGLFKVFKLYGQCSFQAM